MLQEPMQDEGVAPAEEMPAEGSRPAGGRQAGGDDVAGGSLPSSWLDGWTRHLLALQLCLTICAVTWHRYVHVAMATTNTAWAMR